MSKYRRVENRDVWDKRTGNPEWDVLGPFEAHRGLADEEHPSDEDLYARNRSDERSAADWWRHSSHGDDGDDTRR
jgi:hypothetical protein